MWRPCACTGLPAPIIHVPGMPPATWDPCGEGFPGGCPAQSSGESARGAEQGRCFPIAEESLPPGGRCVEHMAERPCGSGLV